MEDMTRTSFGDQLQQMWHTRPVRLPRQGPIAGVAAGFGSRYNVDPVLIRVALVVSTIFGGAGIVLYLLAWLLLPEAGEESAAEALLGKGRSSQSTTKTVVLIVALAIAVSTMGPVGVGLGGSGVIGLALLLAGWWMLHMRHPEPPPGTAATFEGFYPDTGLTATGYPGTTFPMSGQMRGPGDAYSSGVPPTTVYTPYTKLPDAYVPDPPQDTAVLRPQADGPDTAVLHTETANRPGDADTAVLRDDTATELLRKDSDAEIPAPGKDLTVTTGDATPSPVEGGDTAVTNTEIPSERTSFATPSLSKGDPRPDSPPRDNDAPRSGPTGNAAGPRTGASAPADLGRTTPPSWDPLGVAPLAWDLPEPAPARPVVAPPPPKKPRSRLTPAVIGLAILAAAGAGSVAASGVEWMTPARIGAAALAVVGLGLVLGAFLRRGYGLLVLAAPLAGFVVLASLVGPIEFNGANMGDQTWAPTTMAELQEQYEIGAGSATLDLRKLELTESRPVHVSVGLGSAQILLPATMSVRTTCEVGVGDQKCPAGLTGEQRPGAPVLDLTVEVGAGNAEVNRG